jgi:hypothetical protein
MRENDLGYNVVYTNRKVCITCSFTYYSKGKYICVDANNYERFIEGVIQVLKNNGFTNPQGRDSLPNLTLVLNDIFATYSQFLKGDMTFRTYMISPNILVGFYIQQASYGSSTYGNTGVLYTPNKHGIQYV